MAETISPDCYEALRRYGPNDPIALLKVAGGYAFCCGPDYPVNQIVGMGLYDEVTAADLDELEDFFRSRGVPCAVVLSPLAHESLRAMLGERGYSIAEFNSVLIRRIQPEEPFSPPPGVTIERVTDDTVGPWMAAIAKGFEQDIVVAESVFGGFATLPGALPFLARIEDKVVGGCGGRVIPEARIAAFFGTATLPEYRGRGVQTALIATAAARGGAGGLRVCCGEHESGQRIAAQHGASRLPCGVHQGGHDAHLAGRVERIWISKPFGGVASAFPHATENVQWGYDLCFKIDGKLFAVTPLEPAPVRLSFKASPENFAELCERPGIIPAPYMARAQWVALQQLNAVPDSELRELLRESYRMVFARLPRKRQLDLQGAVAESAGEEEDRSRRRKRRESETKPKPPAKKKAKPEAEDRQRKPRKRNRPRQEEDDEVVRPPRRARGVCLLVFVHCYGAVRLRLPTRAS